MAEIIRLKIRTGSVKASRMIGIQDNELETIPSLPANVACKDSGTTLYRNNSMADTHIKHTSFKRRIEKIDGYLCVVMQPM